MKYLLDSLKSSQAELKKIYTLTVTAMLAVMNVVLGFFTVNVTSFLRISFSSLTTAVCGMLYGPVVAGLMAGITDIIKYMINPAGPFFPGFTFNAILGGIIYGLFFYKKDITLLRVAAAKLVVMVIVNLCLTTLWNSILYGQGFWAILPMRTVKNLIQYPVDVGLLYFLCKAVSKMKIPGRTRVAK